MSEEKRNQELHAYEKLLEQLKSFLDRTEERSEQAVSKGLEEAKEKVSEWTELSREELEHVGDYLKRDLTEAADFLEKSGNELRDWLSFDAKVIEQQLFTMFESVADQTRFELERFRMQAEAFGEWKTGEITGIGTLECKSCGEQLHFEKPGHIPPCPKCHGTTYRRV